MSHPEKLKGILGLAFKAQQLVPGAEMSLKLIKEGKAGLALLEPGASENTRKKVRDACNHYQVQVILLDAGQLGMACGRPGMAAAAVKPGNFAQMILKTTKQILEDKG